MWGVEPALHPLDREPLRYPTANTEDGACLDVVARDFWWQNRQRVFFDVEVFNHSILTFHCPDSIVSMSRRKVKHMMSEFERACFSL